MKRERTHEETERLKAICRRLENCSDSNAQRAKGELQEVIRKRETVSVK